MSPKSLAILRDIERETRRLVNGRRDEMGATFPRDYYRPADMLARWSGPGRFGRAGERWA